MFYSKIFFQLCAINFQEESCLLRSIIIHAYVCQNLFFVCIFLLKSRSYNGGILYVPQCQYFFFHLLVAIIIILPNYWFCFVYLNLVTIVWQFVKHIASKILYDNRAAVVVAIAFQHMQAISKNKQ